jgi:Flp pilus assembly pilin Flp
MIKQFNWRNLTAKFIACLRDDSGVAMTEYLLVTGIMIPLAAYLFNPDNGFYQEFRSQYNLTTTLLMYPGP